MEKNIEKNNQMLLRHFQDLSRTACERNHNTYTDFLNLDELSLLQTHARELPGSFLLYGGREHSERQVACFLPEWSDEASFPVSCIHIILPGAKFASKSLTHRDYLGAVLGLGIDRSKIGDIIVVESEGAYFFCISNIASFLLDELKQVGRQSVRCELVGAEEALGEQKQEEIRATVSSCRLDAVIGAAFRTSRKLSQELIEGGRTYVNARQVFSSHYTPEEGEMISIRGYGKFVYAGETGQSKKGRLQIRLLKYI